MTLLTKYRWLALACLMLTTSAVAQDNAADAVNTAEEKPDSQITHFKDWAVECQQPDPSVEKTCVMFQRQALKNGQTLLAVLITKPADVDTALINLRLPLGVLLQPGVAVSVDEGEVTNYPYQLCNNGGCVVAFPLDESTSTAFIKGQEAKVTMITANGQPLRVQVSLKGFTAALNTL